MWVAALLAGLVLGLVVGIAVERRRRRDADDTPPARPPLAEDPDRLAALVVEQLAAGVVIVDRGESVLLTNPAARALGTVVADRLSTDPLRDLAQRAMTSGQPAREELAMPRTGRDAGWIAVTAVPLRDPLLSPLSSRVSAVALVVEDVTDARRLDAVRRDFVANVSHELKTPVGALTLLAEALQDAADDPDAVSRFAGRMQHEGARLGRLVRELIALSRLEGAERLPDALPVSVGRIMREAVGLSALAAEQADITVVCSGGEEMTVAGNEAQLVSALTNLVDNAVRYSPPHTRVVVAARRTGSATAPTVEITVTDQGIGIAESDLPRVFERFFRVDEARSRATGGTGLGLAIVKHTMTNHGGSIAAWSVLGAGSTFTITLPLLETAPVEGDAAEADALPADGSRPAAGARSR